MNKSRENIGVASSRARPSQGGKWWSNIGRYLPLFIIVRTRLSGDGLRQRALRGSALTIFSYGFSQILRLGSNLILTRLLFPEAFGLMSLVQVFVQGLAMFSDMGISPSIIQNKRGDEATFLNTAWTIQAIRGTVLWGASSAIAWPAARIYEQPLLLWLLPAVGFSAFIAGFNSTKLITANRDLRLAKLTAIELSTQCLALAVMVLSAYLTQSVWSLVLGGTISSFLKLFMSHSVMPGEPNRLYWDKDVARSLTQFGKWIFVSSVLGFLAGQADRLMIGKFMSIEELGVYSIAAMLAGSAWQLNSKLSQQILFPIYAKLQDATPSVLRPKIARARIAICLGLLPVLVVLFAFGEQIIATLYDDRYREAGWMLRVLAFGFSILVGTNIGPFYLGQGKSKLFTTLIAVKTFLLFACMGIASSFVGSNGIVYGVAASNVAYYPIQIAVYQRFKLWIWRIDLIVLSILISLFTFSIMANPL